LLFTLFIWFTSSVYAVDGNPVLTPVPVSSINITADVLNMLGSANSTAILSSIGADQFYEPGDNITTAYGTSDPSVINPGQIWVDTDEDTDGALCFGTSLGVKKCGPNALAADKIFEGDTSWEAIDGGTGEAVCKIDDVQKMRITADGADVNGTVTADGFETDATEIPEIRALCSLFPGEDKYAGKIYWNYEKGVDGAEYSSFHIQTMENGDNTTQMSYEANDTSWVVPVGKNLVLEGGYIVGAARIGTVIDANATLATDELRGITYKVSAACTVVLDAAADVGYGYIVGFKVKDAVETLIIRPEGGEIINLHGTALAAGTGIQSPGNTGDFIFLMAVTDANGTTDGYETWGYGEEAWTSE